MGNFPKIFLIFGLISKVSFAESISCQIEFYPKTFYIGEKESIPLNDLIERSNCPLETQKKIHKLVLDSQDNLKASYLKEAFYQYSPETSLEISPSNFELKSLMNTIDLPKEWLWQNLKVISAKNILHGNEVSINCPSCNSLGKKALEIRLDNKTIWAEGELVALSEVLISKSSIASNQNFLSPTDFELVKMPLVNPDIYFSSLEEIQHYRLNVNLSKGTLLKKAALRKIDLIKPGVPVKLSLRRGGISIKSLGMPMSSGKIGELVKIKNQKTNAILFGKVIGENNVTVDL